MKKNTYITILTIITSICVVFGICFHIYKFTPFINKHFGASGAINISDTAKNIDSFDSIIIDADVADLTIEHGKDFAIDYTIGSNVKFDYKVENNTLSINEKVDFELFNTHSKYSINITIPADKDIANLDIKSDVGDIDIDNMIITNSTIQTDVGDIDLNNVKFDYMNIQADVGSIKISSDENLDEFNIDITTDVGDIKINNDKLGFNYTRVGNNDKKLTINANVGDVKINY